MAVPIWPKLAAPNDQAMPQAIAAPSNYWRGNRLSTTKTKRNLCLPMLGLEKRLYALMIDQSIIQLAVLVLMSPWIYSGYSQIFANGSSQALPDLSVIESYVTTVVHLPLVQLVIEPVWHMAGSCMRWAHLASVIARSSGHRYGWRGTEI